MVNIVDKLGTFKMLFSISKFDSQSVRRKIRQIQFCTSSIKHI